MEMECTGTCGDCHCGDLEHPAGIVSGIEGYSLATLRGSSSSLTADVVRCLLDVLESEKINVSMRTSASKKLEEVINSIDVSKLI